ncbi:MAG: hypothetical protein KBG25_06050 [Paludibacteraceae bacterium]|nr:hypothetical protein [Paludibacteraceae bacterium]
MKKIKLLCTILLFSNYHLLVGNSLQNKNTNRYTQQSSTIYVEDESTMRQQPTNNNERENAISSSTSGPCQVKITGNTFVTLSSSTSSPASTTFYRIMGDLYVGSGSNLNFNMGYNPSNQGVPAVIVEGDISNYGTMHFANSTNGGNLAFQCHMITNNGSLSLSENTTTPSNAIGGNMILSGNFINNGTFNCNGRAVVFTGSENQQIGGTASGTCAIDFMKIDKTGGTLTLNKDVACKGYSSAGGDLWAVEIKGSTLILNGKTLTIGTDATITGYQGRAGVRCNNGKIKGDGNSSLVLRGNWTNWTKDIGQNLIFDQSINGTTNVLKQLSIQRKDSATNVDKITINNIIIKEKFEVKGGQVTVTNNLTIDTAAVGTLSSTASTVSLKTKNLILGKTPLHAAEFYRNGRTLTIDNNVKVKVHFYKTAQWNFIAFPFAITSILKADTSTTAVWNTDYSVGIYDATRRARRISGWKTLQNVTTLKADTGYIINKKGSVADLFFVTSEKATHKAFGSPTSGSPVNTALTYTTSPGGYTCNFGWNFISQPLVAKATSSLASGEFAYSYDYTKDTYKLCYSYYNPAYTYSSSSTTFVPYEAFFVKTAAAGNLSSYLYSPQGVRRNTNESLEEIVQLNLETNENSYETLVRILPEATADYDELYDAPYSDPWYENTPRIYTLSSGYALALNSVPEETQVPIYVKVPQTGNYSFTWQTYLNGASVTLHDQQTGAVVDLTAETQYSFETSSNEIKNRFYLNIPKRVIDKNVEIINTDPILNIYTHQKNIDIQGLKGNSQIALIDMAGHILQIMKTSDDNCTLSVNVPGVYLLLIKDDNHANYRNKIIVY